MLRQGQGLLDTGSQALLVKGGHATGPQSTDILLRSRQEPVRFDAPRLGESMRGTGCMLASAVAAHLANARSLEDPVRKGKLFVFESFQKQRRQDHGSRLGSKLLLRA
jgi:hydroxymethylpyrimidine/phosphomethylpyrimidine kinase